ncbi:UspA domain protein [Desulfofarcimen acetoxidans DSM 771]|uniref:UspA domain protein n=1 Tax=Desulfofarcimen acetoxidans (strain ATCC 49208 / DSM 771 / KCTC 5769 / VKM B-1644 / 5575) TaxID=485916 RepID=C8W1N0_DESAS|nr:universal stress protein [Desulfofarcimen acetoxidans]ACV63501.1 UspA domain protein [Desulfofarcimen acetoxidans DSM 771]
MSYKILVAFDGSDGSVNAANFGFNMAYYLPDVIIEVITVFTFTEEEAFFLGVNPEMFYKSEKEKAEKINSIFLKKTDTNNIPFSLSVLDGNPAKEIVKYAIEEGFNHIIMGSRGWGKIRKLLMGSVCKKVLENSHCSVTVVK